MVLAEILLLQIVGKEPVRALRLGRGVADLDEAVWPHHVPNQRDIRPQYLFAANPDNSKRFEIVALARGDNCAKERRNDVHDRYPLRPKLSQHAAKAESL